MNRPQFRRPWAMAISIALHLLLVASLYFSFQLTPPPAGTSERVIRDVGITRVHRRPAESVAAPKLVDNQAADDDRPAAEQPSAAPPAGSAEPLDLRAALDDLLGPPVTAPAAIGLGDLTSLAESLNQTTGDGNNPLVPGRARLGGGAGRTTTSVFGVTGTGATFVYVFDRSESMAARASAPLRAAKSELVQSLRTLTERQQFQIIFYNEKPTPYRPGGQSTGLILGEPVKIDAAVRYVESVIAVGGTEHVEPLRMALRLSPDVVFFLSDAAIQSLGSAEIADLKKRCDAVGSVVHAIQFGVGPEPPGGSFLRPLAEACRGKYRYVDTAGLR